MISLALPEALLHSFLRRSRKNEGTIALPPLGQQLAEILAMSARLVPSCEGSLLLDTPSKRRGKSAVLTYTAIYGARNKVLLGAEVPTEGTILSQVYRSGKSLRAYMGSGRSGALTRYAARRGYSVRSFVATPIVLEKHVCGVFELTNRKGRLSFSDRDLELVKLIGGYISRSILNAVDILKQNELALYDPLTGIRNVRGLQDQLEEEVSIADKIAQNMCVLFVDLDKLKLVNDKHGHRVGSESIRKVAQVLWKETDSSGHVFRFGGDEFVILCRGMDESGGHHLAERILQAVPEETKVTLGDGTKLPRVTVSVGVAPLSVLPKQLFDSRISRAQHLLAVADKALYRAKRQGRNRLSMATKRDGMQRTRLDRKK